MSSEALPVEEALSRAEQRASPLYAGRVEVYAKAIRGQFRTIKWAALVVLLGDLLRRRPGCAGTAGRARRTRRCWSTWPAAGCYFFGIEIWPQEVYYLTGLLMLAAFGLFLATALFGRLWCGFACPQTVWTDLFMQVERWIEGDRDAAHALRQGAAGRRRSGASASLKHAVWLLIAFLHRRRLDHVFPRRADGRRRVLHRPGRRSTVYFFVVLFTATTYLLAGLAREQVCTYMCPWPRIQGRWSTRTRMAVTYEAWRGEPRGKYRKGESFDGPRRLHRLQACVAVCPMGIDIRDGLQLECIGCGLCIDACDEVMDQDRPAAEADRLRQRAQPGAARGAASRRSTGWCGRAPCSTPRCWRVRRRRSCWSSCSARSTVDVNILPDRNPLFVTMSDGSIRNGYTIRVMNKEHARKGLRARGRRQRGPAQRGRARTATAAAVTLARTAGRRGDATASSCSCRARR